MGGHSFCTKTRATKCRQKSLLTQLVISAWEFLLHSTCTPVSMLTTSQDMEDYPSQPTDSRRQHLLKKGMLFKTAVPNLFGTRDQFHGRYFFHEPRVGRDGFRIIQAHYIYCAIYFYYYYISSTSDHKALVPQSLRAPAIRD